MKPRDQGGVVDARLNVYGVEGLKVAGKWHKIVPNLHLPPLLTVDSPDMSICPTNVGNVRHVVFYVLANFEVAHCSFFRLEYLLHCIVGRGEGCDHNC